MSDNILIYYDVNTGNTYNEVGDLYGNNVLTTYFNNKTTLEIRYVTETESGNPSGWTPWTGLSGLAIGTTLAFDNDYLHAVKGSLASSVSVGATTVSVNVSIDSNSLNPSDKLILYRADGTTATLLYSAYESISGGYTFTLTEPTTEAFAADLVARIPQALYLKIAGDDTDASQASTGIFKFKMYAMSHKILNALDYVNTQSISGTLEHQIKSEGNIIRTFTMPLRIDNLIDFENGVNVPSQEGDWADKAYVMSFFNAGEITQYSSDGVEWHDIFIEGVDKYYRVKLDTEHGVWSDARPVAYGAAGVSPTIGENGNWYIGDVDTGVVAAGSNAPQVMIQYSSNGSEWSIGYTQDTTRYIRFSVNGGTSWSSAMRYIGENAPQVSIQYSETGAANTWHDVMTDTDYFIHFSVDGGTTYSDAMRVKAYNVKYQYGETATSSFHDTFVAATDKYIRFSSDNGASWTTAYKFIGDAGQSFVPNQTGTYADLVNYDAEEQGFAFLVTSGENVGKIYFKISDESGAWSDGLQFTPNGLSLEYSEDGSSWHTTSTSADKYVRFSTDAGVTWSATLQFQGTSAYLYVAYASDASGNDFSLTRTSELDYWNWIQTDTAIPAEELTAQKFAELGSGWTLYQGDDGISYEWLAGTTVPAENQGKDGDWYLNTSSGDVYNKSGGTWLLKMNIVGATGAGVTLKGVWTISNTYSKADMVTHNGSAYIAERANTGIEPGTSVADWTLYISKGEKGDPGEPLEDNYVDVASSELVDGYIVVPDLTIPVKVEVNGVGYDIDDCPIIHEGSSFKMLASYFLAKANLSSYSGSYRVWRAGGKKGDKGDKGDDSISSVNNVAPDSSGNVTVGISDINNLQSALDSKFNKTGGAITGKISTSGDIVKSSNTSVLHLAGGTSLTDGAFIALRGSNYADAPGQVFIRTIYGNNQSDMRLYPDGTFTWDGKNVVRSINGNTANSEGNITPQQTGCLPTTGGIMTGTIVSNAGTSPALCNIQNSVTGASLYLFNPRNDNYKGGFILRAEGDYGSDYDLKGNNTSSLTWVGKDITLGFPDYSSTIDCGTLLSYTPSENGWMIVVPEDNEEIVIYIRPAGTISEVFCYRGTHCFLPVKANNSFSFCESSGYPDTLTGKYCKVYFMPILNS